MNVEYRDIPNYPGYRVGNDGSVWSLWNNKHGLGRYWRWLKPVENDGKMEVTLYKDGMAKRFPVPHLVLNTFVGLCPPGLESCHNDGDFKNNSQENLRWDSRQSNMDDRTKHGKTARGEAIGTASLTEFEVLAIRATKGKTQQEIAEIYHISQATVSKIRSRKIWSHI